MPYNARIYFRIEMMPINNEGNLDFTKMVTEQEFDDEGITQHAYIDVLGYDKQDCFKKLIKLLKDLKSDE